MAVIRAIEIGFGTLSYVENVENGVPVIKTFSSVVAGVNVNDKDLSSGLNKRNTIRVQVGDEFYEVGPDAGMLTSRKTTRVLDSSYTESYQYKALLLGALGVMNEPVIDVLGLGLPVENFNRAEEVKKAVIGTHVINDKKVVIKDVLILPQPYCGLMSYVNSLGQSGFNSLRGKTILSLDPGYGTLDWVVTAGMAFNDLRSDGCDLGFSTVIEAVSSALKSAFPKMGVIPESIIDQAFWLDVGVLKVAGKRYPFPVCNGQDMDGNQVDVYYDVTNVIKRCIRAGINQVRNSVRQGADVELILLMGGPHKQYIEEVQLAYPTHDIVVVKNPLTAICEGLFIASHQYFEMKQKGAA